MIFASLLLLSVGAVLGVRKTALGGLYSDARTWCPAGVPEAQDDVFVPTGAALTLDRTTARLRNVVVERGGTLRVLDNTTSSEELLLTCRSVIVFGVFEAGTPTNPFVSRFRILLSHDDVPVARVSDDTLKLGEAP